VETEEKPRYQKISHVAELRYGVNLKGKWPGLAARLSISYQFTVYCMARSFATSVWIPFVSASWDIPDFMRFKELSPGSMQYLIQDATYQVFSSHKNIFLTMRRSILFPTRGVNSSWSMTAINQPISEKRGERERGEREKGI
jgi:hypothetical protein